MIYLKIFTILAFGTGLLSVTFCSVGLAFLSGILTLVAGSLALGVCEAEMAKDELKKDG